MLTWRRCASGVLASYFFGHEAPNGAVKQEFTNTDPVRRTARNTLASTSWSSRMVASGPEVGALSITGPALRLKPFGSKWRSRSKVSVETLEVPCMTASSAPTGLQAPDGPIHEQWPTRRQFGTGS